MNSPKDYIANNNLPVLAPDQQRHCWIVAERYVIRDFIIPAGFKTDLDSVPHVPGLFALIKGRSRVGALVHDYLYRTHKTPRDVADEIFYELIIEEGSPEFYARAMYWAVRLFGNRFYKRSGRRPLTDLTDNDN